jgi:hypothetical protein
MIEFFLGQVRQKPGRNENQLRFNPLRNFTVKLVVLPRKKEPIIVSMLTMCVTMFRR